MNAVTADLFERCLSASQRLGHQFFVQCDYVFNLVAAHYAVAP